VAIPRLIWRSILLLLHLIYGVVEASLLVRQDIGNGVRLPEPEPIRRWLQRLCRILQVDIRVEGDIPHRATLLAANHISWLDIAVLGSVSHSGFLSKSEVRRWPLIGWLAETAGTLFIHRGAGEVREVAEAIKHRLNGDRQLAIFPEGTTTDGRLVKPFFPRLFAAAIETATPVVPVTVAYDLDGEADTAVAFIDDQPVTSSLLVLLKRRQTRARLVFHQAILPGDHDRKALAHLAWTRVSLGLSQRRQPHS